MADQTVIAHQADIDALLARKEQLRGAGQLTPSLEAQIDAHIDQLRANVQAGAVPLGQQPLSPEMAQGEVALHIQQAHTSRALEALGQAQGALATILTGLDSALSHDGVAGARATLSFCISRLSHESAEIVRNGGF